MTSQVLPVRKALSAAILIVALFIAVVAQLTVVNRLPLPSVSQHSGAVPDLVLLLVTAIAVASAPALAAITGFAGGLALDIAPPAAHYAGEYALVFCLVCYAASRVYREITLTTGGHDPVTAFTVMAAAAAVGEAGKAALGMLLSDPDVTTAAVSRVLPGAILYDLLLSPFVFLLVARVTRGAVAGRAPALEFSGDRRLASAFRQASVGAVPRLRLAGTGMPFKSQSPARRLPNLRLAGTGRNYATRPVVGGVVVGRVPNLRLAGTGKNYAARSVAGRVPKLRLSDARSRSIPATAAAFSGTPRSPLPAGRTRKLNFAGDLQVRTAKAVRTPGKNWLRSATSPTLNKTRRPRSSGGASIRFASGTLGTARPGVSPIAPSVPRTAAEALAARSAPSGLSALSGTGTPLTGRRAPQAGWLSGSRRASPPAVRKTPRSGWLGSTRGRPRTVIGSGVRGRSGAKSPSGAWLRRSRNYRKRRQRLLRMMGVGQ